MHYQANIITTGLVYFHFCKTFIKHAVQTEGRIIKRNIREKDIKSRRVRRIHGL